MVQLGYATVRIPPGAPRLPQRKRWVPYDVPQGPARAICTLPPRPHCLPSPAVLPFAHRLQPHCPLRYSSNRPERSCLSPQECSSLNTCLASCLVQVFAHPCHLLSGLPGHAFIHCYSIGLCIFWHFIIYVCVLLIACLSADEPLHSMRARIFPLVSFVAIFPVSRMPFRKLTLNEFLISVRESVHGNWETQALEGNNSYYLLSTLFCGRCLNVFLYLNLSTALSGGY